MKKLVKNSFLISCGILMSLSFVGAKGTSFKRANALSSQYSTNAETYYSNIKINEPDKLLGQLHDLMVNTHLTYTTYDNCKDSDIIYSIEPGTTSEYITDFYTQNNIGREWNPNNAGGWNREHVWCQSQSIDADTGTQLWGTKGGGSDLHHVRPIEYTLNSKRNNTPYGKAINRVEAKSKSDINTFAYLGGYLDTRNDIFEPLDTVKGDVARILFYDYTHYSSYKVIGGTTNGDQNKCNTYGHLLITNIVNTPEKTEESAWKLLLDWNASDPVSEEEMRRNNVVASYQGNRNPFIDHPEYANLIWGEKTLDRTYVTDKITRSSYGNGVGDAYTEFENISGTSSAKYTVNASASSANTEIQIRPGHPIYTTVSGGYIKQIKAVFNSDTYDDRKLDVYCSFEPLSRASIVNNGIAGTKVGSIEKTSDGVLKINKNYRYVLVVPASNAIYLDSISFTWGDMNLAAETNDYQTKANLAINYDVESTTVPDYKRLTENLEDFSGRYLIVTSYNFMALNGSLDEINVTKNGVQMEANEERFIATDELERYEFLISKVDGGYTIYSTIQSAYIGHSGSSNNDLKTSSTPYVHKISIDSSGYALISIGGYTLQYNSASNALCFRYYTSNQKPIMLYKYDGDNCENKFVVKAAAANFGCVMPYSDMNKLMNNHDITGIGVFVAVQSNLKGKSIREIYRESGESAFSTNWMTMNNIYHNARLVVDSESKLNITRTDADGQTENTSGSYVTWKVKVNISQSMYKENISAVAYMIVDGEYCFFDQRNASVASLAKAYLDDENTYSYSQMGMLNYLAGFDVDE